MRMFKTDVNIITIGIILFTLITIHNTSKYGASLSWMLPGCMMIMVGYIFCPNKKVKSTPKALIFYWITILISTVLSNVVQVEQDIVSFAVLLFSFYLVSTIIFEKNQIQIIIGAYVLSALFCSLSIIHNWLVGDFYISWTLRASYRFLGEYKDPNYVTAYICPAVFFLYIMTIHAKTFKNKLLFLLSLFTLLVAILCTGSRAPVVTIIVALGSFYMMDDCISHRQKITVLIIATGIFYMMYRVFVSVMPEQVFDRLRDSADDSRLTLWHAGMKAFLNNPLIGSGLNSSNVMSNTLAGNHCHNVYIDALAAGGIIGNTFLLYIFIKNCTKSNRYNRKFMFSTILVFFIPLVFINGFNSATFITPLMITSILSNYCSIEETKYQNLFVKS